MYLGIDTTNNNLCYGLLDQDKNILYSENIYPCHNSAEILAPKIYDMLQEFSLAAQNMTHIISVNGPGGFSGVRIGTAFVTGFTAGMNIDVTAISSLEALALSIDEPQENSLIIACLNARRNEVYIALFDAEYQRITPDQLIKLDKLSEFLKPYQDKSYYLAGHGHEVVAPNVNKKLCLETLEASLAEKFTARADLLFKTDATDNQPVYLRMPDAKLPQKKLL